MPPTDTRRAWRSVVLLLLGADILTGFAAQSIAYAFRFRTELLPPVAPMNSAVPPLMVLVLICSLAGHGLYRMRTAAGTGFNEYRRVVSATVVASISVVVINFFVEAINVSRGYLVVSLLATSAFVCFGRFAVRRLLRLAWSRGLLLRRVLVIGANAQAVQLARDISTHSGAFAQVLGMLDEYRPVGSAVHGFRVVGDPLRIDDAVTRLGATHVVVVQSALSWEAMRHVVGYMHRRPPVQVLLAPGVHAVNAAPLDIVQFASSPLLAPALTRIRGLEGLLKRVLELAIVVPALVVVAPIQFVIAIALRRRGSKAFNQETCIGRGMDPLTITTFAAGGRLRDYHLQRLPSLVHVVTGRMSLIGPRPIPLSEVTRYERHLTVLGALRPGFIGPWWLVQRRRPGAIEDEVRLDLEYARNYTIWMDVRVLLRVGATLLRRRPAPQAAGGAASARERS